MFVSPRGDWDAVGVNSTNVVQIDACRTPIARVTQDASRLAIVAHQLGLSDARVSVYRYDESDQPTPWNVDHYSVWLNINTHPEIHEMVNRASTSYDDNLVRYLGENVFWVKEEPGDDHWLPELPTSVLAVVEILRSSA